jgi:hypothetical protein
MTEYASRGKKGGITKRGKIEKILKVLKRG